jgi:hypothetical protein
MNVVTAFRAGPCLAVAAAMHLGLILYLALVRFPWLILHRVAGPGGPSALLSIGVHAAALIGMGMIGLYARQARTPAPPRMDLEAHLEPFDQGPRVVQLPVHLDAGGESSPGIDDSLVSLDSYSSGAATEVELAELFPASEADRKGQFDLAGLGLDREFKGRTRKTLGEGKTARFFGLQAQGDSFVFVVDSSGSMEGNRFRRACAELRRTLEELDPEQRYSVIFYSTYKYPMPGPKEMLPATPENVAKTVRWINQVRPGGWTYPIPAFLHALHLDPDAIFLLTDGEFEPEILRSVRSAEGSEGLPVHTIGFESQAGEAILKAISDKSGGTYRHVR